MDVSGEDEGVGGGAGLGGEGREEGKGGERVEGHVGA